MKISPRDNLLRTLRCDDPQWVPVCLHLFPNENTKKGVPEQIKNAFECSSGNLAKDILKAGEYIGTEEYLLPVTMVQVSAETQK